jgi:hypothetical protein
VCIRLVLVSQVQELVCHLLLYYLCLDLLFCRVLFSSGVPQLLVFICSSEELGVSLLRRQSLWVSSCLLP